MLDVQAVLELCINVLFYFTIGSLGGFHRDLYETITGKITKIRLGVILISGTVSATTSIVVVEVFDLSLNFMVLVSFLLGVLGFEIFGNIRTLKKFQNTIDRIVKFKDGFLQFLDVMSSIQGKHESRSGEGQQEKKNDNLTNNTDEIHSKDDVAKDNDAKQKD